MHLFHQIFSCPYIFLYRNMHKCFFPSVFIIIYLRIFLYKNAKSEEDIALLNISIWKRQNLRKRSIFTYFYLEKTQSEGNNAFSYISKWKRQSLKKTNHFSIFLYKIQNLKGVLYFWIFLNEKETICRKWCIFEYSI